MQMLDTVAQAEMPTAQHEEDDTDATWLARTLAGTASVGRPYFDKQRLPSDGNSSVGYTSLLDASRLAQTS